MTGLGARARHVAAAALAVLGHAGPLGATPDAAPPADPSAPAAREKAATDYDFLATSGPFYGRFTDGYGEWYGLHSQLWLLDVTGLRRWSGYIEVIDLRWRPERSADPLGLGDVDSDFFTGRVLHYWSDELYTFVTLGGTVGDAIFPRVQAEIEADYIVPQHPSLVLAVGGGYRNYDPTERPFLVLGGAYSLPRAAFLYRVYAGGGLAPQPSTTHLLTLVYGERLKSWWRADFVWGDEAHPRAEVPFLRGATQNLRVDSRAVNVTWEKWLRPWLGVAVRGGVSDSRVRGDTQVDFARFEGELRPFITF